MLNFLIFIKKFNSYEWKNQQQKRRYYVRSILNTQLILGKTSEEVEELLGKNESCSRVANRWTYTLYNETKTRRKYFLVVYFEHHIAVKVRKEYKSIF
ncbi:hypothetical protein [Chryseobacterium hagamense]|uniref:Uncharacterized protein n=1 Tax=Chryseobacterium hagamense TaxID=395935 RepID=A0A511YSB6_9FLAO|nr:hypothetical protein [Chryseobacterium hagamense]GEN78090.1 hypothetical protein CHA01nite_38300 [Chryseobacterium hagamense]